MLSASVGTPPFICASFVILFAEVVVMSVFLTGFAIDVALTFKFLFDGTPIRSSGVSLLNVAEVRFEYLFLL